MGIFFFVAPLTLFALTLLALVPPEKLQSWARARSIEEWTLMVLVSLSTLLTFAFGFLKQRDV